MMFGYQAPSLGVTKQYTDKQLSRYGLKISAVADTATDSISVAKDEYPVLFGVKMSNARSNIQPRPIGWLYYNSANELLYADGKPDNMRKLCDWNEGITYRGNSKPRNYSPFITKDGDIIFVFKGEQLGTTLPVLPDARQNPIIYPAGDYDNPVVVDLGDIKATSWLQNAGAEYLYGQDCFIFAEYTRPVHEKCYVWKVTKPFTTPSNWVRVKEFTVSGEIWAGFKHCHCVNYDPFSDKIYLTTGDDSNTASIYESSDYGETWLKVLGPSEKYCRLINFVFTKDKVYWASDSGTINSHFLFEIGRDSNGAPDFTKIVELFEFPYKTSLQATYGLCYINEPNGLLVLDRCDATNTLPFEVYFWSFETNSIHIIETLRTMEGKKVCNGFRCEAISWYQAVNDNRVMCGFGNFYPNNNDVLGNIETDRVSNLALEVIRKNHLIKIGLASSTSSRIMKSLNTLISIPYMINYNGNRTLSAIYAIDAEEPTTINVYKGKNVWSTDTLTEGEHTLTLQVADSEGLSSTLQFTIVVVDSLILANIDDWERGTLTGGTPTISETRLRTKNFTSIDAGSKYDIDMDFTAFNVSIRVYNASYVLVYQDSNWRQVKSQYTVPVGAAYIKLVVKKVDDSNIFTDDIVNSDIIFKKQL